MATISGSISGLNWLNPTETPMDALQKGVQTGNLLTQAMAARQRMSIEAQRAPLMLDALETRNKVEQSQLAEQWLRNREIELEQEAWRQDASRPEFQALMAEPDPNRVLSIGLVPVRSFKAQKQVQDRLGAASQSVVVQARKNQYTELNKLAAEVMNGGETPTQVVDQWGVPTWNPQELAQLKNKVIAREQEQKLAIEKARGERTIEGAKIRAAS